MIAGPLWISKFRVELGSGRQSRAVKKDASPWAGAHDSDLCSARTAGTRERIARFLSLQCPFQKTSLGRRQCCASFPPSTLGYCHITEVQFL